MVRTVMRNCGWMALCLGALVACGEGESDSPGGEAGSSSSGGGSNDGTGGTGGGSGGSSSGGSDTGGTGAGTGEEPWERYAYCAPLKDPDSLDLDEMELLRYGRGSGSLEFNGQKVEFSITMAAEYGTPGIMVNAEVTTGTSVELLSIELKQEKTGELDCTQLEQANIAIQAFNSDQERDSFESEKGNICQIIVAEFGKPGEPIQGSFSGELRTFLGETATIANGTFEAVRGCGS